MNNRGQRRRIVTVVAGALATLGVAAGIAIASSAHAGGVNKTVEDGSVRFSAYSISPASWWALITVSGAEVVSGDL